MAKELYQLISLEQHLNVLKRRGASMESSWFRIKKAKKISKLAHRSYIEETNGCIENRF